MCIAVEVGLEKRRYLLFASQRGFLTQLSSRNTSRMDRLMFNSAVISAAFFTEWERPAETVMHKRRIVFSMA